jgi:hypothetical protein
VRRPHLSRQLDPTDFFSFKRVIVGAYHLHRQWMGKTIFTNDLKERPMDIFKMLKKDHDLVKKMIARLEKMDEEAVEKRETLFQKIKEELTVHSKSEEAAVYARLHGQDTTKNFALEGTEEHEIVDRLLQKLDSISASEERWTALVTVLKEVLEHHVDEEESEMFKKMKKAFSKEELTEMARSMKTEKKDQKAALPDENTKSPIYESEDAVFSG